MRAWAAMMVALLGSAARGQEMSTAEFLGPEDGWARARLELRDVHGLWGGRDVRVDGAGRVIVRVVDPTGQEERYEATVPADEAKGLLRAAADADVLNVEVPQRRGAPDEARPRLVVVSGRGLDRSTSKWAGDAVPAFDGVQKALVALADRVVGQAKPTLAGRYDQHWRPAGTVVVHASIYSGRENPRFELAPGEVATLREKLASLPPGNKGAQLELGGFALEGHGVEGVPFHGWVHGGWVGLDEGDTRTDAHGLEAWLRGLAKARGIALP